MFILILLLNQYGSRLFHLLSLMEDKMGIIGFHSVMFPVWWSKLFGIAVQHLSFTLGGVLKNVYTGSTYINHCGSKRYNRIVFDYLNIAKGQTKYFNGRFWPTLTQTDLLSPFATLEITGIGNTA
jgi:hypothetical protein